MRYQLHHGKCLDVLRTLPDNSVDSVVTDPPYGLSEIRTSDVKDCLSAWLRGEVYRPKARGGFMGKEWDAWVPGPEVWTECLRVLKPGGSLLAFSATRTADLMTMALRLAGFEIRDMIAWVYGSGFPKSHNGEWGGTALKPALEPITVARKPLDGTVEANWREHGTGALNIDACRVPHGDELRAGAGGIPCRHDETTPRGRSGQESAGQRYTDAGGTNFAALPGPRGGAPEGRWPANLIHDGHADVVALFPSDAGAAAPVRGTEASMASVGEITNQRARVPGAFHSDSGSAARFFYCAKADKSDRDAGLHEFALQRGGAEQFDSRWKDGTAELRQPVRANTHPTVKPTDLMRYLCRLVTPPGGTVLDPYNGSGSTGKGAVLEGFDYIGIEREAEHIATSRARIDHAVLLAKAGADVLKPASARDAHTVDLFA